MTALVLAALRLRYQRNILFIAADDRAMREAEEGLGFFAPDLASAIYPSWDCQPYDRVSPSREGVSSRLAFLALLADSTRAPPPVMLTTVAACLQRVVPRSFLADNPPLTIRRGEVLDRRKLFAFALQNGYRREDVVRRAGDYAVRGGIVDVFPADQPNPVRIDCDGELVDSLKFFDALDQRTLRTHKSGEQSGEQLCKQSGEQICEQISLLPASEVPLSSESWRAFRARYRQRFGVARAARDPLFAEAEREQGINGFEHLLPLFFDRLATLADHIPADSLIVFGQETREASRLRRETIADHFEARQVLQQEEEKAAKNENKNKNTNSNITSREQVKQAATRAILPPDALYLSPEEWQAFAQEAKSESPSNSDGNNTETSDCDKAETKPCSFSYVRLHRAAQLAPSASASDDVLPPHDCGGRACPNFSLSLREGRLYEDLRQRVQRKRHLFIAHPPLALARLGERLRENAIHIEPSDDYSSLLSLPLGVAGGAVLSLRQGFDFPQLTVVSESELFGERYGARTRRRTRTLESLFAEARTLEVGEIVVHSDHGIGRFEGLVCLDTGGAPHDCVKIGYAGSETLYLPVEGLESLSRFGDSFDSAPQLDRLGGSSFGMRKARAKSRIKDLADKLIATVAARYLQVAPIFSAEQEAVKELWQDFQMGFPYVETDDQAAAIRDVMEDLASGRAMDRIICGDAGFGKTEVALRAAFIVAVQGAQVLMLAPTTLLAEQHYRLFTERFSRLPSSAKVRIGVLSRLRSSQERTATRALAERGEIQILIGTHAALAKSMSLPNLALQIIDEEQAFGVEQKERWKKSGAHLLSLSATPIPRSLHMALSGLRDISSIVSAPYDRLHVRSFVLDFDAVSIGEALRRERLRGGQSFCVVPRIADLARTQALLERVAADASLVVAHGRLASATLEQRMRSFVQGEHDILLSTNIVEAGLDIPRANTMIILDAQRFGLAQLYQLRGRVGRAKLRGYCYFFIPEYARKQDQAMQRLQLMETLDSVGAGLRVSMQDLDTRGAGNLLGEEQSGKIREIGVELYRKLLREAIAERKIAISKDVIGSEQTDKPPSAATDKQVSDDASDDDSVHQELRSDARINLGIAVLIPTHYVAEEGLRMALYRRLSLLEDSESRRDFRDELEDRFGALPAEVRNLLALFEIKDWASRANIASLEAGSGGITISFVDNRFAEPDKLIELLQRHAGRRLSLGKSQNLLWRVPLGKSSRRRKRAATSIARLLARMSTSMAREQ